MANAFEGNAYGQNYATGGGFMSGGGSQATPGGGTGKSADKQSTRPVTIQQINSASQAHTDAEFMIDGKPVVQLTFVGVVRLITTNATNVIYHIDDGTGAIEVRAWADANASGEKYKDIVEWTYVRVIGSIKSFQSRRYITTGHLRRVTDPNEIFYHKLEAIHVHQRTQKEVGGGGASSAVGGDDRMKLDNKRYEQYENPIHRKIMQTVEALAVAGHESGVPISAISRRIPSTSEDKIKEHVETLVGEGYLYTAEDDEHVLSTMSME